MQRDLCTYFLWFWNRIKLIYEIQGAETFFKEIKQSAWLLSRRNFQELEIYIALFVVLFFSTQLVFKWGAGLELDQVFLTEKKKSTYLQSSYQLYEVNKLKSLDKLLKVLTVYLLLPAVIFDSASQQYIKRSNFFNKENLYLTVCLGILCLSGIDILGSYYYHPASCALKRER